MIGKFMRKTSGEEVMWSDPSKGLKDVEIIVSHVNIHQKVTSAEEIRNRIAYFLSQICHYPIGP